MFLKYLTKIVYTYMQLDSPYQIAILTELYIFISSIVFVVYLCSPPIIFRGSSLWRHTHKMAWCGGIVLTVAFCTVTASQAGSLYLTTFSYCHHSFYCLSFTMQEEESIAYNARTTPKTRLVQRAIRGGDSYLQLLSVSFST